MRAPTFLRIAVMVLIAIPLGVLSQRISAVSAAALTGMSDVMSSNEISDTGVTHSIELTTATTSNIKRITVEFATSPGSGSRPAGLDVSGSTLGTVTGLGSGWSLNTSLASSGILYIERASADNINSGATGVIPLQNITNSALRDCEPGSIELHDTCDVGITTYSDDGTTAVDTGDTSYTVFEDPNLTFKVEDVPSGETHNGVTSNVSSTSTSIAFGHISDGDVRYGAQKLTITTNAPHGYTVYAKLVTNWTGDRYPADHIDPFAATNAAWDTPQNWSSPTGTTPSTDTGWFGGNTSDTGIPGWSSGSGKFGPISETAHEVMTSTGPARSGDVVYVSYAIEVNNLQQADGYSVSLVYDVQPIF